MSRRDMAGWKRVTRPLTSGWGVLDIYCRPGADHWPELAVQYWEDRLGGLTPVASSRFATVQQGLVQAEGALAYFKRFRIRDWRDALKHLVRPSRGRRALLGGKLLAGADLGAPRSLCLVEARALGVVLASALVTEALADAPSVRDWLNRPELGICSSAAAKREFLGGLGREIAAFHAAGFHHSDMRLGNVLCRRSADGFRLFWLDNEGVRRFRRLPARLRIHNLMQINMERTGLSATDRMRVWKAYAERAGIGRSRWRGLLRQIGRWTLARWRKRGWVR